MTLDGAAFAGILAMALVTYATRVAGLVLVDRLALSGRAKAAFDAIPPAVLTAVIAPTVLAAGPAETLAALAASLASSRLPLLATVGIGVAAVVLLRAALG